VSEPKVSARSLVAAAIYVAAALYAGVSLYRYPPWTVDDALIVARYARHLAEHGRLTWNLSGDPVEGYTGVALPLVVALGMKLGLAPRTVTLALGIASFFAAAWTLRTNQRRLGVSEPVCAYVTAIALVFPPLFAHATSGLETTAFVATLSASLGSLLAWDTRPRGTTEALLWAQLLLLSFLRPEGVLFACVFGCVIACGVRRRAGGWRASAARVIGIFALPYGAYFAWRATYYGRWLPNTFYAKTAIHGFDGGFLAKCAELAGVLAPLWVAGIVLTLLGATRVRLPRAPLAAVAACLVVLAVQYSRSTLVMDYAYRFQIHGLFLVLPFLGVLLDGIARWAMLPRRYGSATGTALALLTGVCLVAWPIEALAMAEGSKANAQRYLEVETQQHAVVGAWLSQHLARSEAIACWVDAGTIAWTADDHVAIDFGRLNDEYLARPGLSRQDVADYFFSRMPGALVMTRDGVHHEHAQHDGDIVTDDARFVAYEHAETFCTPGYPTAPCELLYLRRGARLQ
jgi:hypothetical protein